MRKRKTTLRRAAYHEAGHVIAHHHLGLVGRPCGATIDRARTPEEVAGLAFSKRTLPAVPVVGHAHRVDREAARQNVLTLIAGPEAEMLDAGDDFSGGGDDYKRAVELLRALQALDFDQALHDAVAILEADPRANEKDLAEQYGWTAAGRISHEIEDLQVEARALLKTHWHEVDAVAKALLLRRSLTGQEIQGVIARSSAGPAGEPLLNRARRGK